MTTSTEYQQLLTNAGVPLLQKVGVDEVALSRQDALRAVEILRRASLPILGGDVYFERRGDIESAIANWHADPRPGESRGEYLARSWATTETYIQKFPQQPTGILALFVLVVGK